MGGFQSQGRGNAQGLLVILVGALAFDSPVVSVGAVRPGKNVCPLALFLLLLLGGWWVCAPPRHLSSKNSDNIDGLV